MSVVRKIYRIIRSVLFTAVIAVAAIYILLYVALSLPPVQNLVKEIASEELGKLMHTTVKIDRLDIMPFNEVRLHDAVVYDEKGEPCLKVATLGAGIDIWKLIGKGSIVITYGEISGMNLKVYKETPDSELNIQFIIDAFKPKDKNKPPTLFDLQLKNIVIRKSEATYDMLWQPRKDKNIFDPNHIKIYDLRADLASPQLKNDDFTIDCRRISFSTGCGFELQKLSFRSHITPNSISVNDLVVKLPGTEIRPNDLLLKFDGFKNIPEALKSGNHELVLVDNHISPQDFRCFMPLLDKIDFPVILDLEANGNLLSFDLDNFTLRNPLHGLYLSLKGSGSDILQKGEREFALEEITLDFDKEKLPASTHAFINGMSAEADRYISSARFLNLKGNGIYSESDGKYSVSMDLLSGIGDLTMDLSGTLDTAAKIPFKTGRLALSAEKINIAKIFDKQPVGTVSLDAEADFSIEGKNIDASGKTDIISVELGNKTFSDIHAEVTKASDHYTLDFTSYDPDLDLIAEMEADIAGVEKKLSLYADVRNVNLAAIPTGSKKIDMRFNGVVQADLKGKDADDAEGFLVLSNCGIDYSGKHLYLTQADFESYFNEYGRNITLESDWVDLASCGNYHLKDIVPMLRNEVARVVPALVTPVNVAGAQPVSADFDITLKAAKAPYKFLGLGFWPDRDVNINGKINSFSNSAILKVDAPLIAKGDKRIRETALEFMFDDGVADFDLHTVWPVKKGTTPLSVHMQGENNSITTSLGWDMQADKKIRGNVTIESKLTRNELSRVPDVQLRISPSTFWLKDEQWNIDNSDIWFDGSNIDVRNFRVWHDGQFVEINGLASDNPDDHLTLKLASIDLDGIFNFLNINYVNFGGIATGEIEASELLTKNPKAATKYLDVKNLAYNNSVLGDGRLSAMWDNNQKKVGIGADIRDVRDNSRRRAMLDGGIWVTRDSLSFTIDADSVQIGFLQPFMSAFASSVEGCASGKATLYGTFKDIDLKGRLHADRIRLGLDFTKVVYTGSDSVFIDPGRITIPGFKLHDLEGNSADFSGTLEHDYFHNPRFEFRLNNAHGLLCYDTNASVNPDWYGKIYGSGKAVLRGVPGVVNLDVEMSTAPGSSFTFVLSDTQVAEDYPFLSFSDKRKEAEVKRKHHDAPDVKEEEGSPTIFAMRLLGTVTEGTDVTLVMDPAAGDKIKARGEGALQMSYNTEDDDLSIYGKYILSRGQYNFSLQDLILRDFKIREGSSISFNGDPMRADLDIAAIYRVNTNLSDLDKSFASDRDLNRTNVPVDAVLMVRGEMEHPDISFDLEMPTLTQDVERKVKSIISTDDLMNRQIIYLLALNRFYTPEYMGGNSGGAELASVASSTISSQLANMMGQLTNKFTLAPSFRSDKGDFSDMEVDLFLSSHLLNNRLLLNGNFGYRDRSTSQTTFIGDFDIEYLLSRSGNLRLKAYNHFNDQNYYLKSALTTQGLGIVYRKDFDNPFTFLRKRKKEDSPENESGKEKKDSVEKDDLLRIGPKKEE